ncbi:hypothetical protein ADK36_02525 [Streptomyces viridochromogenes]|nr:hypothetical protein ADK36_02525 [Streptomyces viridochromogenes]
MYERKHKEPDAPPPPPVGTIGSNRPPGDVRIGDFLLIDGAYLRIRDMRAAGTAAHRVLHFAGYHPPLVMKEPVTTYRPINFL